MRVLLLDTGFSAAPIFDYLSRAGHEVWVMGNRAGDVVARRAGDRWIEQDYGRVDDVRDCVSRLGIDCIVPGCTDVSIETCLALGLKPDLMDSPATYRQLGNKADFRALCERLDLPAPRTVDAARFPAEGVFICKPVDGFSGRGITVFDGMDADALAAAKQAAAQASPTGGWLIETFQQGDLHSCSTFIEGGAPVETFYVLEGSSANRFAVDTSHVTYDLPGACTTLMEQSVARVAVDLGLKDGLLHTQFLFDGTRPQIIEMSRRCPGDLYALLIEYGTGFPYAAKYASYLVGDRLAASRGPPRAILRHTVSSVEGAVYAGLRFREPRSTVAFFPLAPIGTDLLPRQGTRTGILFCEAAGEADLKLAYTAFMSRDAYELH